MELITYKIYDYSTEYTKQTPTQNFTLFILKTLKTSSPENFIFHLSLCTLKLKKQQQQQQKSEYTPKFNNNGRSWL